MLTRTIYQIQAKRMATGFENIIMFYPEDIKIRHLEQVNKDHRKKIRLIKYYFDKFKRETFQTPL